MTLEELRLQVRFKVGDYKITPPVFEDSFYDTEIGFALWEIFPEYTSLEDLELGDDFLVVLGASAQMCYARASLQISSRSVPDITTEDIKKLEFDDIGSELWDTLKPAQYWLDLAKKFADKLKAYLKKRGKDLPEIYGAENMVRIDRGSDGFKLPVEEYKQATPTKIYFESITADTFTFRWDINRDMDFLSYKLYASNEHSATHEDILIFETEDRTQMRAEINLEKLLNDKEISIEVGTSLRMYVWNTDSTHMNIYDAGSNEMIIGQEDSEYPTTLTADNVSDTTIDLSWTEYTDEDFHMYEVYINQGEEVSLLDTLVYSSYNSSDLTYTLTGLDFETTYSIIVYIWKKGVNGETYYSEESIIVTETTLQEII